MGARQTWNIRSMLEWCQGYLGRQGDEAPRRSAEVLVGKACGLERIELYLDLDRPLAPSELDTLREDVRKRASGMPLQYLTGTAPFRYLELKVAPGVLIPRPETEVLVSEALALLPPAPKPQDSYDRMLLAALHEAGEGEPAKPQEEDGDSSGDPASAQYLVADICTGSGCIACSVATEHPSTQVIATDISPQALVLAAQNVKDCKVVDRVTLLEGDLGGPVDESLLGSFDLVLSNPPYVPTAVMAEIPCEVSDFEPALALDGGVDGLDIFRRLLPWALRALRPGGSFVCELHEDSLEEASTLARHAGFSPVRVVQDLAGRDRVLVAGKGHAASLLGAQQSASS